MPRISRRGIRYVNMSLFSVLDPVRYHERRVTVSMKKNMGGLLDVPRAFGRTVVQGPSKLLGSLEMISPNTKTKVCDRPRCLVHC